MILFLEDWVREDNMSAIVDLKTSNRSFVRVAGLLRIMGIKNHTFMLSLYNPDLQGVDPYDENLTDEQKIMIITEIALNPWYFFREIARVPAAAGSNPVPFRANRANVALLWLAFNHITSYLIQPRQTGKTVSATELLGYFLNLASFNTKITVLTKDDKLRTKTAVGIKEVIELLPTYLQVLSKKDIKNTERITVKELGNELTISVAQKDKKAADNLGRGLTTAQVFIDEFAYFYNIDITLPIVLSATV